VLGLDVSLPEGPGIWMTRLGDEIDVSVASALRRDRDRNLALPGSETGHTRVFRDGSLIGESDVPGRGIFEVPPAPGEYRVEVESIRGEADQLSTQVSAAWTHRSEQVTGEQPAPLPILSVRFAPLLDGLYSAPSDRPFLIPVNDPPAGRACRLAARPDGRCVLRRRPELVARWSSASATSPSPWSGILRRGARVAARDRGRQGRRADHLRGYRLRDR